MDTNTHQYSPPKKHSVIPQVVANYLDGKDLLTKKQALRISTVNADGWPHAALLSAGDAIILPNGKLRFAMFKESGTVANITRNNHFTFSMVFNGSIFELRFDAKKLKNDNNPSLTFFEGDLQTVLEHKAPYADLETGVTFSLHHPQEILLRWNKQIETLKDNLT